MMFSWNALAGDLRSEKSGRGSSLSRNRSQGPLTILDSESGATVTELAIVTVIVLGVAAIAVPAICGYVDNIRNTEAVSRITGIELCLDKYYAEYGKYPDSLARTARTK